MDMSSSELLSELELEDIQGLINQYQMSKLDNFNSVDSFSSENPCLKDQSFQTPARIEERPDVKLPNYNEKADDFSDKSFSLTPKQEAKTVANTPLSISSTFTISLGDPDVEARTKKASIVFRNPIQAQDHVLAERKRRQKLTHRFISLSALLPNLKKMDKASVLEDATNYIKELQVRVKELEGLSGTKRNDVHESVVSVKRSKVSGSDGHDHGASPSDETNSGEISSPSCKSYPEIEVQMSGSSVLVRIQCQKNSYSLVKALNEMEKIGLFVISSSAMPFANTTLLITIVAKMGNGFFMSETDLVKNLQLAF